jgi:hypothetical protein
MNFLNYSWEQIDKFTGIDPYERAGHSMVLAPGSRLFVYGGKDDSGNLLSDLAIF